MKTSIIAIGASLGGLHLFKDLLPELPENYGIPLVIVQHRVADSDSKLQHVLQRFTSLPVIEPEDKAPLCPGTVFLAPPDYHLLVDAKCFHLSTEAPVRYARPSIDVLFESVADAFADTAVAVVLTGASDDGAAGALRIANAGGRVLVQAPKTAESPVMPAAAIEAVSRAEVMAPAKLRDTLVSLGTQ